MGLRTWEDQLWARVCALFEDRIDTLLDRFGGFWNSTGTGLEGSKNMEIETNEEDDEDAFEEQIESVLKEVETVKVNSRQVFSNWRPAAFPESSIAGLTLQTVSTGRNIT